MRKFDTFFKSKNEKVFFFNGDTLINKFTVKNIYPHVLSISTFNQVCYICRFRLLRIDNENAGSASENIIIDFRPLGYEINFGEDDKMYKLYHEILSEKECALIADHVGESLHDKVIALSKN